MFSQKYNNKHITETRRSLWHFLLWKLGHYKDFSTSEEVPADFSFPNERAFFDKNLPSCVWIGHSSFLIEIEGISILTDPVWDTYCSPIPIQALKRTHEPPIPLSDLPRIDFVLISHNHYDHLDLKTVKHIHSFHPEVQWIVPLGLKSWFHRRGITSVHELDRWESYTFKNCQITAVPAQHFSGRGLFDKNKSFWNGYVVEQNTTKKRFYFTGDTGYNEIDFKEIGSKWPSMDLSLIPIGTYRPQKFMQPVHCSPEEALQIHLDVGSQLSIGMHWKTFRLSEEPLDRPPFDLYLSMQKRKVPFETFLALDPGVFINW
jgi:N-acyl-phosphatidylethanolamine-hydrolysing phospholipase D